MGGGERLDRLAGSAPFRRLGQLGPPGKYVAEALMAYGAAVASKNLPESEVWGRVLKRLAQDAPAEISARLLKDP